MSALQGRTPWDGTPASDGARQFKPYRWRDKDRERETAFEALLDQYRARFERERDDRGEEPDPGMPNWEVQREMAAEGLRGPVDPPCPDCRHMPGSTGHYMACELRGVS